MPVRDAVIQLSWSAYDQVNADIVSGRRMGMEVGSDSLGYFRACGLPPGCDHTSERPSVHPAAAIAIAAITRSARARFETFCIMTPTT